MARTEVGRARQGQLVTTYGIGSVLPAADQSFMVCGTDRWDPERSLEVQEPRLARSLSVQGFRSPPAGGRRDVPVVRFPLMHYCPKCRRLGQPWTFGARDDAMDCTQCDYPLVPSRFVACCDHGHIEDFPYWRWVHAGQPEPADGDSSGHQLSLVSRGRSSSLGDIEVRCTCGARPVSMAGSFDRAALVGVVRCHGRRPWLPDAEPVECDRPLRTLQRGSSNVWFPMVSSALSIPPWTDAAAQFVARHWDVLRALDGAALSAVVRSLAATRPEVTEDAVVAVVGRRREVETGRPPTEIELRAQEYRALLVGTGSATTGTFVSRHRPVDGSVASHVSEVAEVSRLREVRALVGFTRVTPPDARMDTARVGALAETRMPWLPAIEVHGEGVFIRLHEERLKGWETTTFATGRAATISAAQAAREEALELEPSPPVTARFIAVHTLAHVLLKELSLDAGYPVASLRERIYAEPDQAGVLVFTASSDAAGSLGGLARLADTSRLAAIVRAAVSRAAWCSSDPVCAESHGSGVEGMNLAACHACVLLPETSCEHMNLRLDRVSLVGTIDEPGVGFMHGL